MSEQYHKIFHVSGTPQEIWEAFLTENLVERWLSTGESRVDGRKGGEFKWHLNGENMEGKFTDLVMPYKKLVFKWKREEWGDRKFAKVTMELNEMSDQTRLELTIDKIPDSERDEVYEIWERTVIPKLENYLS